MKFLAVTRLGDGKVILVNFDDVAEIIPMSRVTGAIPFKTDPNKKTEEFTELVYKDGESIEVVELLNAREDEDGFVTWFIGNELITTYRRRRKDEL